MHRGTHYLTTSPPLPMLRLTHFIDWKVPTDPAALSLGRYPTHTLDVVMGRGFCHTSGAHHNEHIHCTSYTLLGIDGLMQEASTLCLVSSGIGCPTHYLHHGGGAASLSMPKSGYACPPDGLYYTT